MPLDPRVDMAVAFGRSLLAWCLDGVPRPFSATFAVTNRCNLRCSYCNTPFLDPTDLALPKVELLFDRLAAVGVKRLGLAGGEPMARKDIGEIVAMAKARRFYVTMNTNLLLFEKHRPALRGVDLFFTSLDGDREHHEAARGRGSYDGVVETAGRIVAEGRPVVAICVVTEHSIGQMDHLLDVAEAGKFRIHFQPQCTDTAIVRGGIARELTTERLRGFWAELLARKHAGRPVASSVPYLETLTTWDDFTRSAVLDPAVRCAASRGFLYVDPAGHAYPCAYTKGKAPAVDMLGERWHDAVGRETPCTRCSVGPYLEFNLLYQKPVRTGLSVAASYF